MGLSLDISSLESALEYVEQVTGRSVADSLNRAGKHVIIGSGSYPGAMQLTPKASRADIDKISDKQLTGFVVKRLKRTGKWPVTNAALKILVQKERARRRRSVGYAAYAGWSNAAKAMGGRGVKGVTEDFSRSEAVHGSGSKATPADLEVNLVNTAPAAERIGFNALQSAIDNAAQDLTDYATRKLQEGFDKVKG